jgi:hypothetical protein
LRVSERYRVKIIEKLKNNQQYLPQNTIYNKNKECT